MIWRKSEGLTESKCRAAPTGLPPMRFLPSIGSRFSIFESAARKAFLLASTEKSVRGSFRNSGSRMTSGRENLSKLRARLPAVNLKGGKPETFGRVASFFYRHLAEPSLGPMHQRIAAEVPLERGRLLDIGCGPGRLTRLVAGRRPRVAVTGLDLSAAMIRQARRGPALPNLEFREGSPATAGFSLEFDFALSVLSFHHWEEPAEELSAVYRALKPGGRLWIYESDPEASDEEIRADRVGLWGWLAMPPSWQRSLSRGHGFTAREIEDVVRPAVARTPFRAMQVARSGAAYRLELGK